MSLYSKSTMQMPTPPMTLADLEWDCRHHCDDDRHLLPSGALSPSFKDWTLFPVEGSPLLEPTPRSTPVRNAKTSRPQPKKTPKDTKATKREQPNHARGERVIEFDLNVAREPSPVEPAKKRKGASNSRGKKTEKAESPTFQVPGFGKVPRIEGPIPMLGRCPTPPVEEMKAMFAPIETLGEDLRWYQRSRSG